MKSYGVDPEWATRFFRWLEKTYGAAEIGLVPDYALRETGRFIIELYEVDGEGAIAVYSDSDAFGSYTIHTIGFSQDSKVYKSIERKLNALERRTQQENPV